MTADPHTPGRDGEGVVPVETTFDDLMGLLGQALRFQEAAEAEATTLRRQLADTSAAFDAHDELLHQVLDERDGYRARAEAAEVRADKAGRQLVEAQAREERLRGLCVAYRAAWEEDSRASIAAYEPGAGKDEDARYHAAVDALREATDAILSAGSLPPQPAAGAHTGEGT